jgi:hypothetical protein
MIAEANEAREPSSLTPPRDCDGDDDHKPLISCGDWEGWSKDYPKPGYLVR